MDILQMLYDTVLSRKGEKQEGSYTCYLFQQGTDKILKKGHSVILTAISSSDGIVNRDSNLAARVSST